MAPLSADKPYPEETIMNKLIGLVILAGIAAVGVACGGDQPRPSDPTTTTSTTTTTMPAAPPAAAPPAGTTTTTSTTTTDKKP
jgi:hypothetical protein